MALNGSSYSKAFFLVRVECGLDNPLQLGLEQLNASLGQNKSSKQLPLCVVPSAQQTFEIV